MEDFSNFSQKNQLEGFEIKTMFKSLNGKLGTSM